MTDRELMKQVMENICGAKLCEINSMSSRQEMIRLLDEAIDALRKRLAQPEKKEEWQYVQKLNAFRYPSQGLMGGDEFVSKDSLKRGMTDREPVAWELREGNRVLIEITNNPERAHDWKASLNEVVPLYAPRQWVGLTDEEIKEIIGPRGDTPIKGYTRKLFDQIEAKLKEKNGG
jgi:hypothetical protein